MLQKKAFSALLLCGLLQACATAPAPSSSVATAAPAQSRPQQTAGGEAREERICREVPGTGWRFGSREECKTRAQWEAADAKGEP